MKRIAVFASGRGSNFSAIVRAVNSGAIKAELALLVCDNPQALVIEKAKRTKTAVYLVCRDSFPSKDAFEDEIIARLRHEHIDLIVLAGFMRILSPKIIKAYKNKIINIHPALLPAFKGGTAIKDAFDYGAKITGVTVHFVDEKTDHGPIILQQPLAIRKHETMDSLEARIHAIEHKLYPKAIRLFLAGKLKISGRKVLQTVSR
jgi:phosphoribosylglycinamide formyltransferase 1